ncbi:MAG: radical SAM protein [Deltaproteobacteria bacterium]|nr:radical SAM protein [Deltaproteobacteria bacterium]
MRKLVELCLEVTSRCTMHCRHCSTADPGRPDTIDQLSFEEARSIIADFDKLGGSILEISGGEPVLYPSLFNIVDFAKSRGLEVRLYTSGVEHKETYEPLDGSFLEDLHMRGLDKVIFNLQGPNSEIHEWITDTSGSFKAVCTSIERAKRIGFWVGTHFVPMKPNAKSVGEVLELARELKIDEVALLRFVPQGRGADNRAELQLTKEDLWNFLRDVASLRKQFQNKPQIRIGCPLDFLYFIDSTVKLHSCKAGVSTCCITPEGDVIPCPAFKHAPEFVAGNVRSQPLLSIWVKSSVLRQLREIDYRDIEGCSKCERRNICQGRCLAQRFRQHGDPLRGPDPDCYGPYKAKECVSDLSVGLEYQDSRWAACSM